MAGWKLVNHIGKKTNNATVYLSGCLPLLTDKTVKI